VTTGTSIKSGGIKLVLRNQTSLARNVEKKNYNLDITIICSV